MALKRTSGGVPLTFRQFALSKILDALYGSSQGTILYRGASAWAGLAPGTSGYYLKTQGAGADPTWAAVTGGGVGGGVLTFVGSATVAGAAATTLTISSLDFDADGRYFVEFQLDNATGSTSAVSFYYNSDTTAGNYDNQVIVSTGTSIIGARANDAAFISLTANETFSGMGWMTKTVESYPRYVFQAGRYKTSTLTHVAGAHNWRTTSTNVTGITLSASVASSLAIGSVIRVWKLGT